MKFKRPKHGISAKALQNINVKAGEFLLYLKGLYELIFLLKIKILELGMSCAMVSRVSTSISSFV